MKIEFGNDVSGDQVMTQIAARPRAHGPVDVVTLELGFSLDSQIRFGTQMVW
ncbi:MAG: hypothetical protein ACREDR_04375 [Blastocatellia bacterium]